MPAQPGRLRLQAHTRAGVAPVAQRQSSRRRSLRCLLGARALVAQLDLEFRSTKPAVEGSSPSQCTDRNRNGCILYVYGTRSSMAELPALNRVVAGSSPAGCMR